MSMERDGSFSSDLERRELAVFGQPCKALLYSIGRAIDGREKLKGNEKEMKGGKGTNMNNNKDKNDKHGAKL